MQPGIEVFLKKEDSSVTTHYQKLCEMLERAIAAVGEVKKQGDATLSFKYNDRHHQISMGILAE